MRVSAIWMPRSRATSGAETMLTPPSPIAGVSIAAVSAAVSGRRFSSPTRPTYSISIERMACSVNWPAKPPSASATRTQGFRIGASSAVIDGALMAFWIAPWQQVVGHLLGDLQGDVLLRLGGRRAQMRRATTFGGAEQRVLGRRLDGEHVEGGAGEPALAQRLGDRRLVDQPAARAVDQPRARLHARDPFARRGCSRSSRSSAGAA